MTYAAHLLSYLAIYVLIATSLNFVVGMCGTLSLAHASLIATGAYVYAIATTAFEVGPLPALGIAVVIATALGAILSTVLARVRGDTYAVVTLAVQALVLSVIRTWYDPTSATGTISNMTNGSLGIAGIPAPRVLGFEFQSPAAAAAFNWVILAIVAVPVVALHRSPWSRLLACIRDDELAARGIGKRIEAARRVAGTVSCGIAGLAGALLASYLRFIEPGLASLDWSILALSMVLVGGAGNLRGPVVGAACLLAIPEVLRFADVSAPVAGNIRLLLFGAALVIMMHVRPQGLAGEYRVE